MGSAKKFLLLCIGIVVLGAILAIYQTLSSRGQTEWAVLSDAGPLPISLENALGLFDQCSRGAPIPEGEVWLPNETEIQDLERRLGDFIRKSKPLEENLLHWQFGAVARGEDRELSKFRGQFVGFERSNERFIYASYVLHGVALRVMRDERSIVLCDGGSITWGVVYNLETQKFSEFSVNGM